jgi:hypothetical protein
MVGLYVAMLTKISPRNVFEQERKRQREKNRTEGKKKRRKEGKK